MSSPSRLDRWPCYPDIPIVLDAQDEHRTPLTSGTSEQTCNVPHTTPNGCPLQFIRVMSPIESGNPCLKVSIPETVHRPSRNWPRRPTLHSFLPTESRHSSVAVDPSPQESHWSRQPNIRNKIRRERNAAIVQFSLAGSQAPFLGAAVQEKTVQIDPQSGCKTAFGLGIVNDPFNPTPSAIRPASHQRNESAPDIAQRIEERLWQYRSSGNVVKRWLLEIISWIISAICMGVIVGVLLYYRDDRPPRWKLSLTLNTLIAVLSKVASAALLLPASEALGQLKWSWFQGDSKKMLDFEIFDNASRGPWGSLLLLIRTKAKTLAALGAAVTLLSLAMDPFFQQVVDFPERWTLLQANSSIHKVFRYEPHYGIQFINGLKQAQVDQELMTVAQKFFYGNGTEPVPFGNGTRAEIPLSCPTSNCTWPPYETLGFCSACADVSQLLTFACLTTRIDWIANLTGPGTESTYPNGTMCGYFLNATSEEPILMSGYRIDTNSSLTAGEALLLRTMPLITTPQRQPLFGGSINFKHVRNPIVDALIISAIDGPESVYQNKTPTAHECVVSWCVKTVKSSYYWANYREEVVQTFINETIGPYPWQFQKNDKGTIDISYTQNITVDAPPVGPNISDYGLSNSTAFTTIAVFDEFFPSFLTVANLSSERFLRFRLRQKAAASSRTLDYNAWAPPSNITLHMEKLATALTNVIRSSSSKSLVVGSVSSMETYVAVRWVWLSLPLAVLFLCLIFLIATIDKSSKEKDRVGVWKTSALATLLYGLPDDMQRNITTSTSSGTPRAMAKELKIKMLPKTGWRISGNLFSPMAPKPKQNSPLLRQNPPLPSWI